MSRLTVDYPNFVPRPSGSIDHVGHKIDAATSCLARH